MTNDEVRQVLAEAQASMSSSGAIAKPGAKPTGMSTGHYNEAAERDVVVEVRGQQSNPKPGISRQQIERFNARRNAVQAAMKTKYRSGDQTVSQAVDDAISRGMTNYSASSRWTTLSNTDGSSALRFSSKVERDYIKVVLDRGDFKRNY
ncbi:MAG TPA: hypothetical protein VM537_34505 [Anaerolineae bacterium]|nr:hypothetical protein [Anaerolineae bacterium]